ncbi:MAG: putative ABC exporter domain-containing protein [Thermoguttaceae bacterium]|jgi:ABC-type multidrug transport system fused ATPase/permease subunit
MDQALIKLLKLRLRGAVRRSFRGVKTVRGAIFFLLGLGAMLMWLGPQVMVFFVTGHTPVDPQVLRDVLPLILFGLLLMSILSAARVEGIHFTAAEVDFLFSGPFSRRQLLVYKLTSGMIAWLFAALMFSIMLMRYASLWTAVFLGFFLIMIFMHLLTTAMLLAGQSLAERMYTRTRKAMTFIILGLVIVVAARLLPTFLNRGFQEAAHGIRGSALWFWLTMPLEPFVRTISAGKIFPDLIGWALAAAAVDLALLAVVVRIDVNYLESSLVASRKRYALLQRRRSTGRMVVKPHVAWRAPQLPWLGGAGPIAWRQLTTAIRSIHGLFIFFLIILCVAAGPLLSKMQNSSEGTTIVIAQIGFFTILFTRMLAFDFRGDLDYMDWAKSLPLRPVAIALGQLAAPVLFMTAIHLLFLSAVAAFSQGSRMMLLAAMLFSPPLNFVLFGVDNLLFLLFPFRAVATTPGDMQHIGRTMVEFFAKMFVLALCCGTAAALGAAAYWITGGSWIAALALSWLGLLACGCLLVPCIAWAFRKFDVATDTPA